MRPIDQQVILVTGATDGLGRGLARELVASGATVLLHGRDAAKGAAAVSAIREETGSDRLGFYLADFASLAQVRVLSERVAGLSPLARLSQQTAISGNSYFDLVSVGQHRVQRPILDQPSTTQSQQTAPLTTL